MKRGVLLALLLVLVTAIPAWSLSSEEMEQDLDYLYATLQEVHPNLYANTEEAVFEAKLAEIKTALADCTEAEFYFYLLEVVALIGDGHTNVGWPTEGLGLHIYPVDFDYYVDRWGLNVATPDYADYLGLEVVSVQGQPLAEVIALYTRVISYDNQTWLRNRFRQNFYIQELMQYLGLLEAEETTLRVEVQLANGTLQELTFEPVAVDDERAQARMQVVQLAGQRKATAKTDYDRTAYYKALALNEDVYYVQYNRCQEDPEQPIEDFWAGVIKQLERRGYSRLLLDLRNNGGGNDGLLQTLLFYCAEQIQAGKLEVIALVGANSFSSAVNNAVMLRDAGAYLAGSPSGGSVDHFGSVGNFELPQSETYISHSTRELVVSAFLESGLLYGWDSIQPDILLPQTLEDYLAGRDTAVEALLALESLPSLEPAAESLLTRARWINLLYQDAQGREALPENIKDSTLEDVFGFSYYYPAVCWAQQAGIITGTAEGLFAGSTAIRYEEIAVTLARYIDYLELTPPAARTLRSTENINAWAREAYARAYSWNLFAADVDPQGTLSFAEALAVAQRLATIY